MKKVFEHIDGDSFSAYYAAEKWCEKQGFSVGSMQRGAPTLIYYGDCDVAKYRNISPEERKAASLVSYALRLATARPVHHVASKAALTRFLQPSERRDPVALLLGGADSRDPG